MKPTLSVFTDEDLTQVQAAVSNQMALPHRGLSPGRFYYSHVLDKGCILPRVTVLSS